MLLKAGRSKNSYLIVAGRGLHVFIWLPKLGADSWGITIRWRKARNDWQHLRLIIMQRNKRPGTFRNRNFKRTGQKFLIRRTLTLFEFSAWQTSNGVVERKNLKSYLRIKAGAGGRRTHEVD